MRYRFVSSFPLTEERSLTPVNTQTQANTESQSFRAVTPFPTHRVVDPSARERRYAQDFLGRS